MVSPHKSFHEHDVVQAAASSHLFCLSEVTCQWLVTKYMLAILGCGQCPFTVQMIRQANVNNIYVGISHEIVVVSVETRDPEFSCPIACGLEISASDPGEFCFLIRSPQCGDQCSACNARATEDASLDFFSHDLCSPVSLKDMAG